MSNALGTLFGDIANAIREKNGETGTMKPAEFPEKILGIEGSSPDVCYVTFMSYDGSVEYGRKAVAVGDDCANPIARGVFDTPTRESTAQYNYTFAGWATEANGGLDSAALSAVTEDRTVYANFAAVVRYYTIKYYDGDTLLKSESLAYGSTPSYSAEKDDYNFEGWEPELANVTGDASYYAQWSEQLTFAGASWAKIAEISEAGQAADYFAVGDTKEFTFTDPEGVEHTAYVVIVGFDHDTLTSGGTAGISLVTTTATFTATKDSDYGDASQELNQWGVCDLRTSLNTAVFNSLPTALQGAIKSVNKKYGYRDSTTSALSIKQSSDKVWVLSAGELGQMPTAYGANDGEKYPYASSLLKISGATSAYWLRTGNSSSTTNTAHAWRAGVSMLTSLSPGATCDVVFGFCV